MRIERVWPRPLRHLGPAFLRSLDSETFQFLCALVKRRALTNFQSHKYARKVIEELYRRRYPAHTRHDHRHNKRMLRARYVNSDLLDAFAGQRSRLWINPGSRFGSDELDLQNFSFIDDPIGTMNNLVKIVGLDCSARQARINFTDEHMLDISPYIVLGMMRQDMSPVVIGGNITKPVEAAFGATGLHRMMRMRLKKQAVYLERIVPFVLRQRRKAGTSQDKNIAFNPTTREKLADDIVDAVNLWLDRVDLELTIEGSAGLAKLTTEILDNAERHPRAGGDGGWSVAGLMERRRNTKKEIRHICSLAFVNLGLTIGETISNAEDSSIVDLVNRYIKQHKATTATQRELLATVIALQDGMSRVSQENGRERGGVGFMSALEGVHALATELEHGDGEQAMVIISGSTCIKFAPPFWTPFNKDAYRFQWFNNDQSPSVPPAQSHVFTLPVSFPGTIITARFALGRRATLPSEL